MEDFKKEVDEEGYTKLQMWKFMNLFEDFTDIVFEERFSTTILIHKSDLTI